MQTHSQQRHLHSIQNCQRNHHRALCQVPPASGMPSLGNMGTGKQELIESQCYTSTSIRIKGWKCCPAILQKQRQCNELCKAQCPIPVWIKCLDHRKEGRSINLKAYKNKENPSQRSQQIILCILAHLWTKTKKGCQDPAISFVKWTGWDVFICTNNAFLQIL